MSIELTDRAAQEVKGILDKQGHDADRAYLRVAIKGGGCGGFQYVMDLNETRARWTKSPSATAFGSSATRRATCS